MLLYLTALLLYFTSDNTGIKDKRPHLFGIVAPVLECARHYSHHDPPHSYSQTLLILHIPGMSYLPIVSNAAFRKRPKSILTTKDKALFRQIDKQKTKGGSLQKKKIVWKFSTPCLPPPLGVENIRQ